jgi:hypothetical protein
MAGRAANQSLESVRSDVRSVRASNWNSTGIAGSDVSEIGGDGRKGADAKGQLSMPPTKRVDERFMHASDGKAMTGEQGQGGGHGKSM